MTIKFVGIDALIGWRPDDSGFDLIGIDPSTVSRIHKILDLIRRL